MRVSIGCRHISRRFGGCGTEAAVRRFPVSDVFNILNCPRLLHPDYKSAGFEFLYMEKTDISGNVWHVGKIVL